MKIIIASDSFKGSLDAIEIGNIGEKVAKNIFGRCEVVKIPMADGGEGTVDSLIEAMNGEMIYCDVNNPLGVKIRAGYGVFESTAIMEMAAASGITLVDDSERDIMIQNTYGTGQLVLDALENGYNNIYLGIGGSATNDGGIGFASAIGVKFFSKNGEEVQAVPKNFEQIYDIDISGINELIYGANIHVMCDVTNPLLGELGATNVFGRQKGADENARKILEKGMEDYINIAEKAMDKDVRNAAGAGAAGGLGAGLMLFANAKMCSGVDTILDILKFKDKVCDADLVITGEGMMDYQSAYGKVASGVGKVCKHYGVPCIAIVGSMGEKAESMSEMGIRSIFPIVNKIMPLEFAIENAHSLYESAVTRALTLVKIGMEIDAKS